MAKIEYNMLVRDNYVALLERSGKKTCETAKINDNDFLNRLADKLEEEVDSFSCEFDAENDEKALGELADIVEVVEHIVSEMGVTDEAFHRIREARNAMYGSFDERTLLVAVTDNVENTDSSHD